MLAVRDFATLHLPYIFSALDVARYPSRPDSQNLTGFRRHVHANLGKAHGHFLRAREEWQALKLTEVPEIEDMPGEIFEPWNALYEAKRALFKLRCAWELVRDLPEAWDGIPGSDGRLRARARKVSEVAPELKGALSLFGVAVEASKERQRLADALAAIVPKVSVVPAVKHYGSLGALNDYLGRVFTGLEKPSENLMLADVTLWPVSTGADPCDPVTADWAKFACYRQLDEKMSNRTFSLRFPSAYDGIALFEWGIPLEYARLAAGAEVGEYPTEEIGKAWRAGIPADYLAAAYASKDGRKYPISGIIQAYEAGVPIEYVMAAYSED